MTLVHQRLAQTVEGFHRLCQLTDWFAVVTARRLMQTVVLTFTTCQLHKHSTKPDLPTPSDTDLYDLYVT